MEIFVLTGILFIIFIILKIKFADKPKLKKIKEELDKKIENQKMLFKVDEKSREREKIENLNKEMVKDAPEKVANLIKDLIEDNGKYEKK